MITWSSRWIRLVCAIALFLSVGGLATSQSRPGRSGYAKVEGVDLTQGLYQDGTYTGTGAGFRPGLTVEVKVEKGKVVRVKVTTHAEIGSRFYDPPIRLIPSQIVREQSTSVDVVSGATATSYGIMAAVEDALKKAKVAQ